MLRRARQEVDPGPCCFWHQKSLKLSTKTLSVTACTARVRVRATQHVHVCTCLTFVWTSSALHSARQQMHRLLQKLHCLLYQAAQCCSVTLNSPGKSLPASQEAAASVCNVVTFNDKQSLCHQALSLEELLYPKQPRLAALQDQSTNQQD